MSFFTSFEIPEGDGSQAQNDQEVSSAVSSIRNEMAMSESAPVARAASGGSAAHDPMAIDDSMMAAAKGTSLERCAQKHTESKGEGSSSISLRSESKEETALAERPGAKKANAYQEEKQKSNSTSTLYVRSTIQVPDIDGILLSVSLLLHQMIEPAPACEYI